MLKETREAANREYHKFHEEKEKMRNGYLAKLKEKESECIVVHSLLITNVITGAPNRRPGPTIGKLKPHLLVTHHSCHYSSDPIIMWAGYCLTVALFRHNIFCSFQFVLYLGHKGWSQEVEF